MTTHAQVSNAETTSVVLDGPTSLEFDRMRILLAECEELIHRLLLADKIGQKEVMRATQLRVSIAELIGRNAP